MHFSLIKVSDLILVDEDGLVVEGNEPINGPAFTIHSAIHRARPDANAACHAHSGKHTLGVIFFLAPHLAYVGSSTFFLSRVWFLAPMYKRQDLPRAPESSLVG